MNKKKEIVKMQYIKFYTNNTDYFEFSNYYKAEFTLDDIEYVSTEQYYQSQKFYEPTNEITMEYYKLILETDSPQKAKDLGGQNINKYGENWLINKKNKDLGKVSDAIRKYKLLGIKIREDWESVKIQVMTRCIFAKFNQNDYLKQLLLNTGDAIIIEDSPRDSFWGAARNGKNMLGVLLMELRSKLNS